MDFKYFIVVQFYYYLSICQIKDVICVDSYAAAVVEFRPSISLNNDLLKQNVEAYKEFIFSQQSENIDIIVFPEGTLNDGLELTYVPSEKEDIIPCLISTELNIFADFLVELSCAARKAQKYVVINLTEKEICKDMFCANSGLNIYNTNVVFDRFGRVISRYRKVHVYVEDKNVTAKPEYGIFETDFNVRFGHFICFDILFYTPAQELVERYNITNIIVTMKFYSELPFLTAAQLQQGWAWGNNVNFLAAGVSDPKRGSTGSGIYAGQKGALVTTMVTELKGERKLLTARLPKNIRTYNSIEKNATNKTAHFSSHLRFLKEPQLQNFNSILLNAEDNENIMEEEICHNDFCCHFQSTYTLIGNGTSYYYRFGVFNGNRTYEKQEWNNIQVCGVYMCSSKNINSCGNMAYDKYSSVRFKYISIRGVFKKTKQHLIMPSTLDYDLYPLSADSVQWIKMDKGNQYEISFDLQRNCDNLITFGIYANYYDTIPSNSEPFTGASYISVYVISIILSSLHLLNKLSREV